MEVWPKGKFVFSPELGFQGKAERITLKGINQAALTKKTVSEDNQQIHIASEIKGKQEQKTGAELKDSTVDSAVSWKVIVAALFLLAMLTLWFLYKRPGKSIFN